MNKIDELNELLSTGAIDENEYNLIKSKLGLTQDESKKVEEKQLEVPKQEASQPIEVTKIETDTNTPVEQSIPPSKENIKVEVVESPQKKKGILKWVIIVLVILGLGYVGTNLYFQNQLLESSLEQAEELYQNELNTNHEEILTEIYEEEEEPSNEAHSSLIHKTYANSKVSNLNIRSTPALSDNIIGILQLGDRVEVLDTIRIEIKTIKQALLNKDTFIEVEGIRVLFKKGKAFEIIDEWPDETVSVLVDERNNEAIISKKSLDLIDKEIWLKIRLANQQEGYVYQKFLNREITGNEQEIYDYYEVYNTYLDEEDYLNLRSEPTSKSINITRMRDGTKLILLSKGNGSNGKWMKVRILESGKVGYAHTKWIRKINEE